MSEPESEPREAAARPVVLAVDDEPSVARAVERDLRRRYGRDYRVLRAESGEQALEALRRVKAAGCADRATDCRPADARDVGRRVSRSRRCELAPEAKRVLLTAYADTQAAIDAINRGRSGPLPAEAVGSARGGALPGGRRSARRSGGPTPPAPSDRIRVVGPPLVDGSRTTPATSWPGTRCPTGGWTWSATTRRGAWSPPPTAPPTCPLVLFPDGGVSAGPDHPRAGRARRGAHGGPSCPSTTS